jgi:hypothetical protein
MKSELSKTYREINIMLNLLGEPFKRRLPKTMIPFFKEQEDVDHNPTITLTDDGFSGNIQTDTYILMTMMYINYWCDDPEEKEELRKAWMNPTKTGDYDVFSKNSHKNNLGVNAATAAYKDVSNDVPDNGGNVEVDMNKYGNLFDGPKNINNNTSSNNNLSVSTKNASNVRNIFFKVTDSLKGLLASFSRK